MIDELIAWLSAPVVLLSIGGACVAPKWCHKMLYVHLFLVSLVAILYVFLRSRFNQNVSDPDTDELDSRCALGFHEGMRCLHFFPKQQARRKVLLFPGVNISVRRMLRQDFVTPLLDDCLIVCVQPRGLGESDNAVHMSRATMQADALAAFELLTPFDLPVHIIGYSAGGFMAIQLCAGLEPLLYSSLTLIGTMFDCKNMAFDMRVSCIAMQMQQNQLTLKVPQPVMLLHSKHDQHIRLQEAQRHLETRKQHSLPAKLIEVLGKHSSYVVNQQEGERLRKFLRYTEQVHMQALAEREI